MTMVEAVRKLMFGIIYMDSRYISSELLRKVPTTAVYGQVGNDKVKRVDSNFVGIYPLFENYFQNQGITLILTFSGTF